MCKFQVCLLISATFNMLDGEVCPYSSEICIFFNFSETLPVLLFCLFRAISDKTDCLASFYLSTNICSHGVGDFFPLGKCRLHQTRNKVYFLNLPESPKGQEFVRGTVGLPLASSTSVLSAFIFLMGPKIIFSLTILLYTDINRQSLCRKLQW